MDRKPGQRLQRISGRRLQAIRERFRWNNPLCVRCMAAGIVREWVQLDHIVAVTNGGTDTDDNRQGLCAEHHAAKTADDLGYTFRARRTIGVDGFPIDE